MSEKMIYCYVFVCTDQPDMEQCLLFNPGLIGDVYGDGILFEQLNDGQLKRIGSTLNMRDSSLSMIDPLNLNAQVAITRLA